MRWQLCFDLVLPTLCPCSHARAMVSCVRTAAGTARAERSPAARTAPTPERCRGRTAWVSGPRGRKHSAGQFEPHFVRRPAAGGPRSQSAPGCGACPRRAPDPAWRSPRLRRDAAPRRCPRSGRRCRQTSSPCSPDCSGAPVATWRRSGTDIARHSALARVRRRRHLPGPRPRRHRRRRDGEGA